MDNALRTAIRYWLSTGDLSTLSDEQATALHTLLENHLDLAPAETTKILQEAPLRDAQLERNCAVAWNRSAISLNKEAEYWRKRCLENKKPENKLLPKPVINEHGRIVVNATGSLRPFLWIDRQFSSCGGRSDGIGFTFSDQLNDCRPHEGGWSVSWEELRSAMIEIQRHLEETGTAEKTNEHLREEFKTMLATWGSMPHIPDAQQSNIG